MKNYLALSGDLINKITKLAKLPFVGNRLSNFFINFLFLNRHNPFQKVCIRHNDLLSNLYINIFDYSHISQTMNLQYGAEAFNFYDQNIKKNSDKDIFFDFGANIGMHSLYCLEKLKVNKVVLVEPNPICNLLLKKTFSNFETNKFKIYNNLLSNKEGRVFLTERILNSGSGTVVDDWGKDPLPEYFTRTFEVETISTNTIIRSELVKGQKACIKMDIQGSEADVLKDLTDKILNEFVKFIFFEVNGKHLDQLITQIKRYELLGFKLLNSKGSQIDANDVNSYLKQDIVLIKQ